ncbi:MAG: hypothetical protein FWD53_06675 [Phycisphaerales bacterium]|nr:hypothetical protein [Phycisphaerales bacterium]
MFRVRAALAMAVALIASQVGFAADKPGIVSNIKVLSDKVHDVSSLEDWKKSFIKDGMSDHEKAMAIFNTEVMFQTAGGIPCEYLHKDDSVHDAIKLYNVYGHTICSNSSSHIAALARYIGLKARNLTINNHVIPEIYYEGGWRMLDADLGQYFPKEDGFPASTREIADAIMAWSKENPSFPLNGIDAASKQGRYRWQHDNNNQWKTKGPEILSRNPLYDERGWLPNRAFAWGDTMQQFNKIHNNYEASYSLGYRVNVQLREGEKLIRNWSNKGMYLDKGENTSREPPGLKGKARYLNDWGDLTEQRIGNGTLEYDVPLASGAFRGGAFKVENLATKAEASNTGAAVQVKDAAADGVLEIRMPTSYVYLAGELTFTSVLGNGGQIDVQFSDNNGLDWKNVMTVTTAGEQKINLQHLVHRRYHYIARFTLKGNGTGLDALKFSHDIQYSQRALPSLTQGENKITFSSAAQEGTITIEGCPVKSQRGRGKNLHWLDFKPQLEGINGEAPRADGPASIIYPVKTPGDIARVRVSSHFSAANANAVWLIDVSFDDGKTWRTVAEPTDADMNIERIFVAQYATADNVPPGARAALVRYRKVGNGTSYLSNARIDADYKEPTGGFRPVKVSYLWSEGGVDKSDVRVVTSENDTWTIKCETKPTLKSLVVELVP